MLHSNDIKEEQEGVKTFTTITKVRSDQVRRVSLVISSMGPKNTKSMKYVMAISEVIYISE